MLSPDEARILADHAVSLGTWSRAQADAALATPDAANPQADNLATTPAGAGTPATDAHASRYEQEIRAMADEMVARGQLTREQADTMVARDLNELATGIESAPVDLPKLADPLGAVPALDPLFDRPSAPADYLLPPFTSEALDTQSLQAAQALLWQARVPQVIAGELFSIADSYSGKALTEAEAEILENQTMAKLRDRYGDQLDAKLRHARQLVQEVGKVRPELWGLLGTGLGSDLRFVSHLIEHAGRLYGGRS